MSNYIFAWTVYVIAAVIFFTVFWRITRAKKHRFMSYSVRALTLAVIVTPWYVNDQEESLAPAIMVAMMDYITIGPDAAVRAMVPLFLTIVITLVAAFAILLLRRDSRQKAKN